MDLRLDIGPDVHTARTPPPSLYVDPAWHRAIVARVLRPGWHLLHEATDAPTDATAIPLQLGDDPLLYTRDSTGSAHLLSNVCTHRWATMVDAPCKVRSVRCPYHGRRFALDGTVRAAPGFDEAPDFPGPDDHLAAGRTARWGPWVFGSSAPATPFDAATGWLRERLAWLPWDDLRPAEGRRYEFDASWMLWADNYLEGFHIPWVHPELMGQLEGAESYRTELHPTGSLQVGIARGDGPALHPPAGAPDHGKRIGGYYAHLFPTTMINVYPWGVSLNLLRPLGPTRTALHYRFWVWDDTLRDQGAGGDLSKVEAQDQAIVARAAAGTRSGLAVRGRYSPTQEQGVHHFHRLLAGALSD